MLKVMKARKLLSTQMNADVQDNELLNLVNDFEITEHTETVDANMSKYEVLENAPFVLVEGSEGWFIVMGEHIVSEKRFDTKEAAKRYVNSKPWELIFVGASAYMTILEKLESDKNNFKDLNDEQES